MPAWFSQGSFGAADFLFFEAGESRMFRMVLNIKKQIYREIKERDAKDLAVAEKIKRGLLADGWGEFIPKKSITLNTGKIEGVKKVVAEIIKRVNILGFKPKIITIEGSSGTGKSSTARGLAEKLNGVLFSAGEVFRYMTLVKLKTGRENFKSAVKNLHYEIADSAAILFLGAKNISESLRSELRSPKVEKIVPAVARNTHGIVLDLISREIEKMKVKSGQCLIVEGRSFFVDFIQSDLRVKLVADIKVRARRRAKQKD